MKRKLTIAAGIIHSPPILFMDEPTTGIDVASARQIRQLIADLNTGGTTIFLTTHYIEEAQRLCGRIAFIVQGLIVRTDTVEELMRRTDGRHAVQFAVSGAAADLCDAIIAGFPNLRCQAAAGGMLAKAAERIVTIRWRRCGGVSAGCAFLRGRGNGWLLPGCVGLVNRYIRRRGRFAAPRMRASSL